MSIDPPAGTTTTTPDWKSLPMAQVEKQLSYSPEGLSPGRGAVGEVRPE